MKQAYLVYAFVIVFVYLIFTFLNSLHFENKNKYYERYFHSGMEYIAMKRPETMKEAEVLWKNFHRNIPHRSDLLYYQPYPFIMRVETRYEDQFYFQKTMIEEVYDGET